MPEFPDTDRHPARQAAGKGKASGGMMEELGLLGRIVAIAFQLAGEVGACLLIGWLIDRWLGTPGRWIAVGGIVGVALGLFHFVRSAIIMNRRMDRSKGE